MLILHEHSGPRSVSDLKQKKVSLCDCFSLTLAVCVCVCVRLVKLKILEIRENHLKTLPKSFGRLAELERLDIGNNEFTDLVSNVLFQQMRMHVCVCVVWYVLCVVCCVWCGVCCACVCVCVLPCCSSFLYPSPLAVG